VEKNKRKKKTSTKLMALSMFQERYKVDTQTVYMSLGSTLNLSALSILLKEEFRVDNFFDNALVRRKNNFPKLKTRTFFNSLSFCFMFKGHRIHTKLFRTGMVHMSGLVTSELIDLVTELIHRLVYTCHVKNEQEYNEKDVHVIETLETYKIQDIRTVMIHGVYAHPRRINRLEAFKLLQAQNFNVKYDPKLHNALNIRFVNDMTGKTGDGSFLIFESGKIIITGGRSVEKYETRFNEIMNVIETIACYDL